jgi:flagellar biosynthesis protein FlhG
MYSSDTRTWLQSFKSHNYHGKHTLKISICSGKGGVGKTSISLRLAKDFCFLRRKVLLIDTDFNLSNTGIKLGHKGKNKFKDFISGKCGILECIERLGDLSLLPACNGSEELFKNKYLILQRIITSLEEVEGLYDVIIFDIPAGLKKEILNIIALSDFPIILVTPDQSAMTDAYSVAKILVQEYGLNNLLTIANFIESEFEFKSIKKRFNKTGKLFLNKEFNFLGYFPRIHTSIKNFDQDFIFQENNSIQDYSLRIIEKIYDAAFESVRSQDVSGPVLEKYINQVRSTEHVSNHSKA